MSEVSVPPLVAPSTEGGLADYPARWARTEPDRVMVSVRQDDGWSPVTAVQLHDRMERLARGFVAAGIEPGDRVAIMSRTRLEWTLADFALWMVGAVPVPVYETSSAEQVRWIASDAGVRLAVVRMAVSHLSMVGLLRRRRITARPRPSAGRSRQVRQPLSRRHRARNCARPSA